MIEVVHGLQPVKSAATDVQTEGGARGMLICFFFIFFAMLMKADVAPVRVFIDQRLGIRARRVHPRQEYA
eukprot:SAG31_NODE_7134_length_1780_cov_1.968471_1_plen_70_part_00